MNPNDAESLPSRGLHHHPAVQPIHHLSAYTFQPSDFRRDVVCLNVDMHSALVFDTLNFDDRLVGWINVAGVRTLTDDATVLIGGLVVDEGRRSSGVGAELLAAVPEIAASTGSACHAGHVTLSPVLKAMGVSPTAGRGAVRLSVGRFTTEEEADIAAAALIKKAKKG